MMLSGVAGGDWLLGEETTGLGTPKWKAGGRAVFVRALRRRRTTTKIIMPITIRRRAPPPTAMPIIAPVVSTGLVISEEEGAVTGSEDGDWEEAVGGRDGAATGGDGKDTWYALPATAATLVWTEEDRAESAVWLFWIWLAALAPAGVKYSTMTL